MGREATGRVTEVHAARCKVLVEGRTVECRIRGRLALARRKERTILVVGDQVRLDLAGDDSVVTEVLPRSGELSRVPGRGRAIRHVLAANVDRVIVVAAAKRPALRTGFVDRCLAAAHVSDIPGCLCINKMDLLSDDESAVIDDVAAVYDGGGIPCRTTSATTGAGIDGLRELLVDRTSVFVGQSGVGKSTLLNTINPDLRLKTGGISEATLKGRHTTSASRLLDLGDGAFVVDTPGMRSFGLDEMTPAQVLLAYPEFAPYVPSCHFSACSHVHEPECAIRDAVEAGELAEWRYDNYCRIIGSMDELR